MQGYLIRSRAQIIEDDEKPTNYFCNLEKHHFTSKITPNLEKSNGTIINEQATVLREVKTFYENLYSSTDAELIDVDLKHVLSNAVIKKISQDESSLLEGILTYQEVTKALKALIAVQVQMVLQQIFLKCFGANWVTSF